MLVLSISFCLLQRLKTSFLKKAADCFKDFSTLKTHLDASLRLVIPRVLLISCLLTLNCLVNGDGTNFTVPILSQNPSIRYLASDACNFRFSIRTFRIKIKFGVDRQGLCSQCNECISRAFIMLTSPLVLRWLEDESALLFFFSFLLPCLVTSFLDYFLVVFWIMSPHTHVLAWQCNAFVSQHNWKVTGRVQIGCFFFALQVMLLIPTFFL